MPRVLRAEADVFKQQADATLSQANPVSGTKYTVLDTTKNVRIKSITARCTWTVQPTPLEIHLTIDGILYTAEYIDPISLTDYITQFRSYSGLLLLTIIDAMYTYGAPFLVEGRTVKIEAEITGGTVSNLFSRVKYAKIP